MKDIYRPMVSPKDGSLEKQVVEETDLKSEIEKPSEEIAGLIFSEGKYLKLHDFKTEKREFIKRFGGKISALEYFKGTLWVGLKGITWSGISNLKDKGKIFPRKGWVNFFLKDVDTLFDGGEYGLRDLPSSKELITKKDLKEMGIYTLNDLFFHNNTPLALAMEKDGYHCFIKVKPEISLGDIYLKTPLREGRRCGAISVDGKIITTLPEEHLDIDGYIQEVSQIEFGEDYYCIAFDNSRKKIYAGGDSVLNSFDIEEKVDRLVLRNKYDLGKGTDGWVRAMLPVTQEQMEVIREQAK